MKTNHKISVMHVLLSMICGVVLAVHRCGDNTTGSSMFIVGAAAAVILTLCSFAAEHLRVKLNLTPAEPDKLGFVMLALSGFLFVIAALFFLLQSDVSALLRILSAVFCGFCGAVTLLRLSLRDTGRTAAVYSLVPVFFLSYFLLMFYRSNGDNPYLIQFGYEIVVILVVLLSIYAAIAGRFEQARPRFRASCCSIGLCFIAQEVVFLFLMPQAVLSIPGFSLAAAVMLLAYAQLLCYGLFFPPVREVFAEENDTEEEASETAEEAEDAE